MNEKTQRILSLVAPTLEKRFGKGTIIRLTDGALTGIDVLRTGIPKLDLALGVKGLPKGRIVELFGEESSGKTSLAQKIVAQAQAEGGTGGYIDVEQAFDPEWAVKNGVLLDDLLFSQPSSAEEGLEIAESYVKAGADVVVVDSVSALTPQAELDGDFGDSHMGLQARLMSQACRKLTGAVKKSNSILIFINQIRYKIGVMFGDPTTTSGGNALKFYASVRMRVSKTVVKKGGKDESGETETPSENIIKVKIVKNKVAPPFKVCQFVLTYEDGLCTRRNIFDCLVDNGIIVKSGSWFALGNEQLGQGYEGALNGFMENHGDKLVEYYDNILNPVAVEDKGEMTEEEKSELAEIRKQKGKKNGKRKNKVA